MYFLFYLTMDGFYAERLTKQQLEEELAEWQENHLFKPVFLERVPRGLADWPIDHLLIVAGDIVIPQPEEVVTRYHV